MAGGDYWSGSEDFNDKLFSNTSKSAEGAAKSVGKAGKAAKTAGRDFLDGTDDLNKGFGKAHSTLENFADTLDKVLGKLDKFAGNLGKVGDKFGKSISASSLKSSREVQNSMTKMRKSVKSGTKDMNENYKSFFDYVQKRTIQAQKNARKGMGLEKGNHYLDGAAKVSGDSSANMTQARFAMMKKGFSRKLETAKVSEKSFNPESIAAAVKPMQEMSGKVLTKLIPELGDAGVAFEEMGTAAVVAGDLLGGPVAIAITAAALALGAMTEQILEIDRATAGWAKSLGNAYGKIDTFESKLGAISASTGLGNDQLREMADAALEAGVAMHRLDGEVLNYLKAGGKAVKMWGASNEDVVEFIRNSREVGQSYSDIERALDETNADMIKMGLTTHDISAGLNEGVFMWKKYGFQVGKTQQQFLKGQTQIKGLFKSMNMSATESKKVIDDMYDSFNSRMVRARFVTAYNGGNLADNLDKQVSDPAQAITDKYTGGMKMIHHVIGDDFATTREDRQKKYGANFTEHEAGVGYKKGKLKEQLLKGGFNEEEVARIPEMVEAAIRKHGPLKPGESMDKLIDTIIPEIQKNYQNGAGKGQTLAGSLGALRMTGTEAAAEASKRIGNWTHDILATLREGIPKLIEVISWGREHMDSPEMYSDEFRSSKDKEKDEHKDSDYLPDNGPGGSPGGIDWGDLAWSSMTGSHAPKGEPPKAPSGLISALIGGSSGGASGSHDGSGGTLRPYKADGPVNLPPDIIPAAHPKTIAKTVAAVQAHIQRKAALAGPAGMGAGTSGTGDGGFLAPAHVAQVAAAAQSLTENFNVPGLHASANIQRKMKNSEGWVPYLYDDHELMKRGQKQHSRLLPGQKPLGHATIGYGHLAEGAERTKYESRGDLSREEGEDLFQKDLRIKEKAIEKIVNPEVLKKMSQGQKDATLDFGFNAGTEKKGLPSTQFLKTLNKGDIEGAGQYFNWNKGDIGGGKLGVLPGLVRRNADRKAMYYGGGSAIQAPMTASAAGLPNAAPHPVHAETNKLLQQLVEHAKTGNDLKSQSNKAQTFARMTNDPGPKALQTARSRGDN